MNKGKIFRYIALALILCMVLTAGSCNAKADMPLGYVICFAGNVVVGQFPVDGKIVSLNSFLTPDSEYYEKATTDSFTTDVASNKWLPDVDGAYGVNEDGVFWFSPEGNYFEWIGAGKSALYSDYPFKINDPILMYEVKNND